MKYNSDEKLINGDICQVTKKKRIKKLKDFQHGTGCLRLKAAKHELLQIL